MRKLRMKLEELKVSSFATDPQPQDRGTVNAHYYNEPALAIGPALAGGTEMTFCLPHCISCAPECDTYTSTTMV